MASWVRGTQASVDAGVFDGEQIDSPRMPSDEPAEDRPSIEDVTCKVWLDYVRAGASVSGLARLFKMPRETVRDGVKRARLLEQSRHHIPDPTVAILFPAINYAPDSPCAHPDPIPQGKAEYCPQCHETGIEGHPALRRRTGDKQAPQPTRYIPHDGLAGGTGAIAV